MGKKRGKKKKGFATLPIEDALACPPSAKFFYELVVGNGIGDDAVNDAVHMVNRGGKVCLAAFTHEKTPVDIAHIVRNNIYLYGIRGEGKSATHRAEAFMRQKRFDATKIHTHTFALDDLPTALRYAKDRVDDAIKVVVKARGVAAHKVAAE